MARKVRVKTYKRKDGTKVKSHLRQIPDKKKGYVPYNRNIKADELINEVFYGDYKQGWEDLWRQESNHDFKKSFDYIARVNDLPENIRFADFTDRWDGAELLEDAFGHNYKKLYQEYVRQMSNSDFKEAEEYIRRMHG